MTRKYTAIYRNRQVFRTIYTFQTEIETIENRNKLLFITIFMGDNQFFKYTWNARKNRKYFVKNNNISA